MAQGRWKQREHEGTLQPSAAPGLSHTLQRRLRARRTSRTTDCSRFQTSTVICSTARVAQDSRHTRKKVEAVCKGLAQCGSNSQER